MALGGGGGAAGGTASVAASGASPPPSPSLSPQRSDAIAALAAQRRVAERRAQVARVCNLLGRLPCLCELSLIAGNTLFEYRDSAAAAAAAGDANADTAAVREERIAGAPESAAAPGSAKPSGARPDSAPARSPAYYAVVAACRSLTQLDVSRVDAPQREVAQRVARRVAFDARTAERMEHRRVEHTLLVRSVREHWGRCLAAQHREHREHRRSSIESKSGSGHAPDSAALSVRMPGMGGMGSGAPAISVSVSVKNASGASSVLNGRLASALDAAQRQVLDGEAGSAASAARRAVVASPPSMSSQHLLQIAPSYSDIDVAESVAQLLRDALRLPAVGAAAARCWPALGASPLAARSSPHRGDDRGDGDRAWQERHRTWARFYGRPQLGDAKHDGGRPCDSGASGGDGTRTVALPLPLGAAFKVVRARYRGKSDAELLAEGLSGRSGGGGAGADDGVLIAPRGLLFRYMSIKAAVGAVGDLFGDRGEGHGRVEAPWFDGRGVRSLALLNNGVSSLSDLRYVLHDLPTMFASQLTALFVGDNGGVERTHLFRVLVLNTFPRCAAWRGAASQRLARATVAPHPPPLPHPPMCPPFPLVVPACQSRQPQRLARRPRAARCGAQNDSPRSGNARARHRFAIRATLRKRRGRRRTRRRQRGERRWARRRRRRRDALGAAQRRAVHRDGARSAAERRVQGGADQQRRRRAAAADERAAAPHRHGSLPVPQQGGAPGERRRPAAPRDGGHERRRAGAQGGRRVAVLAARHGAPQRRSDRELRGGAPRTGVGGAHEARGGERRVGGRRARRAPPHRVGVSEAVARANL